MEWKFEAVDIWRSYEAAPTDGRQAKRGGKEIPSELFAGLTSPGGKGALTVNVRPTEKFPLPAALEAPTRQ